MQIRPPGPQTYGGSRSNMELVPAMLKHIWTRSTILIVALLAIAGALVAWKVTSIVDSAAAAANQPEPMETIVVTAAKQRPYTPSTTAVGTVFTLFVVPVPYTLLSATHQRVQASEPALVQPA